MKVLFLEKDFKPTKAQLTDIGGEEKLIDVTLLTGASLHEINTKKVKPRYAILFDDKAYLEPNWLKNKYVAIDFPPGTGLYFPPGEGEFPPGPTPGL